MKVIDVSYAQGKSIDWKNAKSDGIDGAILRIGYGREEDQKDSCFEINYKNAKAAGVPILPYHYSYATDTAGAKKEAAVFLKWANGHTFAKKSVVFDLEEQSQYKLGQKKMQALIEAYSGALSDYGWEVIVYSYLYFLNAIGPSWLDNRYRVWVAQYASACSYNGEKAMWQYTSSGNVNGVPGKVDLNHCYDSSLFKKEDTTMKTLTYKNPKTSTVQTVKYSEYGNCKVTAHIRLKEIQCNNGADTIKFDWKTVNAAEAARVFFDKPINITSAYRTETYNRQVGGASSSYHVKGRAMDTYISGVEPSLLAKFYEAYGMKGVGCYYDDRFVHVDSRGIKFFWKNQSCIKMKTHLPNLRKGSGGQDVEDLQILLKMHGYSLEVDGGFGPKTREAVLGFQTRRKLDVDGIVGAKTWAALFKK